jgi:hypothetical protein
VISLCEDLHRYYSRRSAGALSEDRTHFNASLLLDASWLLWHGTPISRDWSRLGELHCAVLTRRHTAVSWRSKNLPKSRCRPSCCWTIPFAEEETCRPLRASAEEFLLHGLKYVFPPKRGEVTRGVPTSYAAPPLDKRIAPGTELPPVWPLADGRQRGVALEPLHRSAPAAALRDRTLYELLALIDAVREGRARERKLAKDELIHRLRQYDRPEPDAARSRG